MLQLKNISKSYKTGDLFQKALDNVSLNFRDSEFVNVARDGLFVGAAAGLVDFADQLFFAAVELEGAGDGRVVLSHSGRIAGVAPAGRGGQAVEHLKALVCAAAAVVFVDFFGHVLKVEVEHGRVVGARARDHAGAVIQVFGVEDDFSHRLADACAHVAQVQPQAARLAHLLANDAKNIVGLLLKPRRVGGADGKAARGKQRRDGDDDDHHAQGQANDSLDRKSVV